MAPPAVVRQHGGWVSPHVAPRCAPMSMVSSRAKKAKSVSVAENGTTSRCATAWWVGIAACCTAVCAHVNGLVPSKEGEVGECGREWHHQLLCDSMVGGYRRMLHRGVRPCQWSRPEQRRRSR